MPTQVFNPGRVGLVSRSGTLTYQISRSWRSRDRAEHRVGIGGDPVVGSSFIDMLTRFEADPATDLMVMVGEIGGNEEEKAAEFITAHDDPGRGVHRRLPGAARQADGPRRGDHFRLVGRSSRRREETLEAEDVRVETNPTEVRRFVKERIG